MSGEIKCDEDKIADALSKLGTLGEKLSSAKDVLNGIDTSGIELPALNIATVCGNIQNDIDGINAVIGEIMQIIAGMNIAENNNLDIIKGILLGAVNGVKYLNEDTTLNFLFKQKDGVGIGAIAGATNGILGLFNDVKKSQSNQNDEWDFTKIEYPDDYRVKEDGILLKDRYQSNPGYSWEPGWYKRYMDTLWYKGGYGHIMYWQSQYGDRNNGSTIQSGGCGITCATLMASELKHKIVEPNEYVKYLAVNGQSGAGDTSIQAILDDESIKYTRTSGTDGLKRTLQNLDTDAYIVNLEITKIHGHWTLFYYDHEKDILVQYDPDPATVLSGKVPNQNERIDNGYLSVGEIPDSTVGFVVKKDDWQQ